MDNISNILISKYDDHIKNIEELNSDSEYLEEDDLKNYIDKLKSLTADFEKIIYNSEYDKIISQFRIKLKEFISRYGDKEALLANTMFGHIIETISIKSFMLKGDRCSYVLKYKYKLFDNITVETKWWYIRIFPFESKIDNAIYVNKENILLENTNNNTLEWSKKILNNYFKKDDLTPTDKRLYKIYKENDNAFVKLINKIIIEIHQFMIEDLYRKDFFLPVQISPVKFTSLYLQI